MIHRGLEDITDLAEKIEFVEDLATSTVTIVSLKSKSGSTYSQVGAVKIISSCGKTHGMLSGGCLEADIELAASKPESFLKPQRFSTLSPEDKYFGYGTGCRGEMHLEYKKQETKALLQNLQSNYERTPMVHIFGAGPDALGLIRILDFLRIRYTCSDYREDLVAGMSRSPFQAELLPAEASREKVKTYKDNGSLCNVVILMSHNFYYDARILQACFLESCGIKRIGVLGPESRRKEIIEEALYEAGSKGQFQQAIEKTVAKVGIEAMGKGRNAVALSITAWVQQIWTASLAAHTNEVAKTK